MKLAGTEIRTFEGRLLLAMVLVDFVFLALSLAHHYSIVLPDRRFSINGHGGFGEIYQYGKEFVCFVLLANAGWRCRLPVLLVWSALFAYLLLTDAFRINESIAVGLKALPWTGVLFEDLTKWQLKRTLVAMVGVAFMLAIVFWHRRARAVNVREDSAGLARLLMLYLVFGVAVDFLHRAFSAADASFYNLFAVVEEWGEMLMMSLLVVGAYLTFIRTLRRSPLVTGRRVQRGSGSASVG